MPGPRRQQGAATQHEGTASGHPWAVMALWAQHQGTEVLSSEPNPPLIPSPSHQSCHALDLSSCGAPSSGAGSAAAAGHTSPHPLLSSHPLIPSPCHPVVLQVPELAVLRLRVDGINATCGVIPTVRHRQKAAGGPNAWPHCRCVCVYGRGGGSSTLDNRDHGADCFPNYFRQGWMPLSYL